MIIAGPILTILSFVAFKLFYNDPKQILILVLPVLAVTTILSAIYHLKFKWDIIEIRSQIIKIKKVFGLGRELNYNLNALKITPSYESVKVGTGEIILIETNGKRISELSDFSYANFQSLRETLKEKVPFAPYSKTNLFERMKLAMS
ncbi:hypothetical protein [Adhaeribacter arboris]|nr:hypothetical protein [Adhaeribacter arboris]